MRRSAATQILRPAAVGTRAPTARPRGHENRIAAPGMTPTSETATEPRVVADIMTRDLITLREEDNLALMQEDMQNFGLRHLPVVDGKKFVGLVSHRDLLRFTTSALHRDSLRASIDAHDKRQYFVADVMTREVITVRPDTPIAEAAAHIGAGRFGCLPVVTEDGTLVGIVSESDFVKLLVKHGP